MMNGLKSNVVAKPTDKERHIIRSSRVARLGSVDRKGQPLVVPVCYAYTNNCIYTPIDKKPKKVQEGDLKRVKNIRSNPEVSVLLDRYGEDWSKLYYLIIYGKGEIIEYGDEYHRSLRALCEKYDQYVEMKLEDAGLPVIRIKPDRIISWGNLKIE
jgi:PPOX class probable F420-dependent enzyme